MDVGNLDTALFFLACLMLHLSVTLAGWRSGLVSYLST